MEIISRLIALILLVALAPLFFIISVFSFIFQGSPIFFKQVRVGYKYKVFKIYKFKTMRNLEGTSITYNNDPRITPWGSILRALKFDELPQLINILKGEMRFIGPRPEVPKYVNQNEFQFLNKVYPGLSDYSSIILRNESKLLENIDSDKPYKILLSFKINLANYYAEKKSLWLDFKLVWLTLLAIIFPNFTRNIFVIPLINRDLPKLQKFIIKNITRKSSK